MDKEDLIFIQKQIGYEFNNWDLLQQAFIRRSYSKENGGEDNEVLEFIGDRALDFVIVKMLSEKYGFFAEDYDDFDPNEECNEFVCDYQEGKLTEFKKRLVEKKMLAQCIDIFGFADYLIMGNGDIQKNVQEENSVKEDLFEAIVGAVALDCAWDVNKIQDVVDAMLNLDYHLSDDTSGNYVGLIQEWALKRNKELPQYYIKSYSKPLLMTDWRLSVNLDYRIWSRVFLDERLPEESHPYDEIPSNHNIINPTPIRGIETKADKDCKYSCQLTLDGVERVFRGFGKSKSEARKDVCQLAYSYLELNNLLFSIQDEIDNPNRNESISQLEILARRGYFSIPTYKFEQAYNNNGNPIWKCDCHIKEIDKNFSSNASSKKDAKKNAAFRMLKYVLENVS